MYTKLLMIILDWSLWLLLISLNFFHSNNAGGLLEDGGDIWFDLGGFHNRRTDGRGNLWY